MKYLKTIPDERDVKFMNWEKKCFQVFHSSLYFFLKLFFFKI